MSIRRASKSSISDVSRGKGSSLIAGYSPAVDEMDLLARATIGSGGASNILFTGIPSTYDNLHLRGIVRTNRTPTDSEALTINFNTDYSSNYVFHIMYGEGSGSGSAGGYTSQSRVEVASMSSDGAASGIFGAFFTDIFDYADTSKNTTLRSLSGNDKNGSGVITLSSGMWMNTSVVTSINLDQPISTGFSQYTTVALYGVRS